MWSYILKRLLIMIPTLLGVITLTFVVIQFVPGGPVEQVMLELKGRGGGGEASGGGAASDYRGRRGIDPQQLAQIKALYGFDKTPAQRYWLMLKRFAKFGLGQSYFHHQSVWSLIVSKLPVSISLGLWTFFLTYLISVPLGIAKAVRNGSRFDTLTSLVVLVGYAMPIAFAVIVVLLWRARRRAVQEGALSLIGEQHLILRGAFALTSALIVFNKVGSPQYMLWLAPIVAAGLLIDRKAWTSVAVWLAVTCFLTTLVFPVLYLPLIDAHPFAAGVLLARNVLLVGLFGWSLVALWRPDATLVSLRERLSRAATTATTGSIPVAIRG